MVGETQLEWVESPQSKMEHQSMTQWNQLSVLDNHRIFALCLYQFWKLYGKTLIILCTLGWSYQSAIFGKWRFFRNISPGSAPAIIHAEQVVKWIGGNLCGLMNMVPSGGSQLVGRPHKRFSWATWDLFGTPGMYKPQYILKGPHERVHAASHTSSEFPIGKVLRHAPLSRCFTHPKTVSDRTNNKS